MYESKRQYQYGTGRRKSSVARVRLYQGGTGSITINGRDIDDYFGLDTLKMVVRQPLAATDLLGKVDPVSPSEGGGPPPRPRPPPPGAPPPLFGPPPSTPAPPKTPGPDP